MEIQKLAKSNLVQIIKLLFLLLCNLYYFIVFREWQIINTKVSIIEIDKAEQQIKQKY